MNKMERPEFARMLRRGRGAALAQVLEHGLADVQDLVIAACVVNQAFDPQVEQQRSEWLLRMFRNSAERDALGTAVAAALKPTPELIDGVFDLAQLCELAALLGRDGDVRAAAALRDAVMAQDAGDGRGHFGGNALVQLDGMSAVVLLARRFGTILLGHPQAWVDDIEELSRDLLDAKATLAALEQSAFNDAPLKAYIAYCKKASALPARVATDATDLDGRALRVFAAAQTDTRLNRGFYRAFGRAASDAHLQRALQELAVTSDPLSCARLLWIFAAARPPGLSAKMFALARHADEDVRYAAIQALSHFRDESVRSLGLDLLSTISAADGQVLELFIKNFCSGDEVLILAALKRLAMSDDEAHRFESSLVAICEENHGPGVAVLAEWVYASTPCSVCRQRAVTRLAELGMLAADMARESLFDAVHETRLAAQAYIARNAPRG